jgi:hypothetical protein
MRNRLRVALAGAVLLLAAMPALAHHAFTAEFDADQTATISGVLTKVDWVNPHVYFYIDVKDESGKVTNWAVECHPTGTMHRAGIYRDMFDEGQIVTVNGWKAKDGTKALLFMKDITLPDGHKIATTK